MSRSMRQTKVTAVPSVPVPAAKPGGLLDCSTELPSEKYDIYIYIYIYIYMYIYAVGPADRPD